MASSSFWLADANINHHHCSHLKKDNTPLTYQLPPAEQKNHFLTNNHSQVLIKGLTFIWKATTKLSNHKCGMAPLITKFPMEGMKVHSNNT